MNRNQLLLARLYEAHHSTYEEDLAYWLNLGDQYPPQALELGCGTGRVLINFITHGIAIIGIDHDPSALSVLREKLSRIGSPSIPIYHKDMIDFELPERFSLILSPCNTFSTLHPNNRLKVLHQLTNHLLPGGCFAASVPNPYLLANLEDDLDPEPEDIFSHPLTGNPVQISSEFQRQKDNLLLCWHYDHLLPNGQVERTTKMTIQYILHPEQLQRELATAGLQIQALWGDFDQNTFTPESPYLIWEARRR